MSILKAVLLTLLLMLIFVLFQIGILLSIKNLHDTAPQIFEHIAGLSIVLGFLLSYSTIFYFFWKSKPVSAKILNLKSYKPSIIFYLFIIAIGLYSFDQAFWDFDKIYNTYYNIDFVNDYPGYYQLEITFVYKIISAILIAPIFEELFFRKYLLSNLLKRYHKNVAIGIASLCFALIHIETPNNLIPTFLFGIISGLIYIKTKKIGYSMILHLIMNSFWLILVLTGDDYYLWILGLEFNLIYWILVFTGLALTIIGTKKIITGKNATN